MAIENSYQSTTEIQKYRILVVEEDRSVARLMLANLAKAGMECRYASDGESAMVSFRQKEPHLVVLDLVIPGINGFAVCTRLRRVRRVPIVVLTAQDDIDKQLHAFDLGADTFVCKPIDTRILLARVQALLRRTYHYDAAPLGEGVDHASPAVLAPGWIRCEACSYLGPEAVFQLFDVQGHPTLACPHCMSLISVPNAIRS